MKGYQMYIKKAAIPAPQSSPTTWENNQKAGKNRITALTATKMYLMVMYIGSVK